MLCLIVSRVLHHLPFIRSHKGDGHVQSLSSTPVYGYLCNHLSHNLTATFNLHHLKGSRLLGKVIRLCMLVVTYKEI